MDPGARDVVPVRPARPDRLVDWRDPVPRSRPARPWAASAGFLAALAMLAAQLAWRLGRSGDGAVPAFPEVVVAAVARLTPLSVFDAATASYGSNAKRLLFLAVLVGIGAVGTWAGSAARGLAERFPKGFGGRLLAGAGVAVAALLIAGLVVLPLAHLGPFAVDSRHGAQIVLQLVVTFAVWAVVWAALSAPGVATLDRPGGRDGPAASRRAVLGGAALRLAPAAGVAAVGGLAWRLIRPRADGPEAAASREAARGIAATAAARRDAWTDVPADPARPAPAAGDPATAEAAPTDEAPVPAATPAEAPEAAFARLEAEGVLTPALTATADFYHVSKNLSDPRVEAEGWRLRVHGLVERELELDLPTLTARATTRKITTLCCISNELNGDLISTAEWTALPLGELLAEAGVGPGAVDLRFRCADDYEDSIPVAQAQDPDTLLVVGMNGQTLPDDHGFPARLIVPGIYGMKNVKWLEEIEVVDEDFKGYWQTRGWSDPAPNQIWARIDAPGGRLEAGPAVVAGVASAGDRGIARVEVSLDDGETWADATLEPALNPPFTWVRWVLPVVAEAGTLELRVRATDGLGAVAPEEENPPLPDGATGWPGREVKVR